MAEQYDWKKIKDFICGLVKDLEKLCDELPDGSIKNMICNVIGLLEFICNLIPG